MVAIIRLGSTLHLDVVAEGVETEEQLCMLRSMCCGQVQGYLLKGPVPATNVVGILDEDCARAASAVLAWQVRQSDRGHAVEVDPS